MIMYIRSARLVTESLMIDGESYAFLCVTVSLHSLQQQVSRLVLGWPGPFLQIALHPLLWLHPPHDCPSVLQPPLKRSVHVEKVSEHHQLYAV